ncbi:MAG: 4-(cytidine 5'-diphospho)-2-C-methyl-D-erythritol kinase [Terriglobales bacterium]
MRFSSSMTVAARSFAKINLGLYIGAARADGFHELRTVYQTIALHDVVRVSVGRGRGIEVLCTNPRVPLDSSNTCWRVAERVMDELGAKGRVTIEIEKRLPVQGGLGAASSNAVATMVGLERVLRTRTGQSPVTTRKRELSETARLRLAAEVGSDLPLFLVGGTTLGVGRGEEVYPLPDLPAVAMVVVTPEVGVSTPQAFADWDELVRRETAAELRSAGTGPFGSAQGRLCPVTTRALVSAGDRRLTRPPASDRLFEVGCLLGSWLSGLHDSGSPNTGASAKGGSRVEKLLLDLVRTGIENDFERVVFPKYPELRDIKGELERAGARYASLSGSGSTLYGLFRSPAEAARAAGRLRKQGRKAVATRTLTRQKYWSSLVASR